jgi:integrase
MPAKDRPFT